MSRAGVYVSLFGFFLVVISSCVGCLAGLRANEPARSMNQIREATVRITVVCDNFPKGTASVGTGVVVSDTEILTAAHVADCIIRDVNGTIVSNGKIGSIYAAQPDGIGRPMRLAFASVQSDVARLAISDDGVFYGAGGLRLAPAYSGDRVCLSVGAPRRDVRCGEVEERFNGAPPDLSISMPVEPGNSGSGLYDRKGRLVGIVTQRRRLENGQGSGGMATSMDTRGWILDTVVVLSALPVKP